MDKKYVLSADNVTEIFNDCLFKEGESTDNFVQAEGITNMVGFHPERLEGHREDIKDMLSDLPDDFKVSKGGGMSFLNACDTKDGKQWTGYHQVMEQLFLLGLVIGEVKYLAPRELWEVFPGGMPYYVIKD